jgi:hypothetical protein
MTHDRIRLIADPNPPETEKSKKLTYWRSAHDCFSIDYKGFITEFCRGDLRYRDMDRMDGIIHAAIGCKKKHSRMQLEKGVEALKHSRY